MQKSIQSPEQPDVLARVFHDIANCAESRLPPALREDRDEPDRKDDKRRKLVAQDVIPKLKGKLFDSMRTRVARYSVEQKLIKLTGFRPDLHLRFPMTPC